MPCLRAVCEVYMVAISFNYRAFSDMILRGDKDQTIRPYNPERYEQIKRIGKLQLYWKQRTKECFKIADAELTEIFKIKFIKDIKIRGNRFGVIIDHDDFFYSLFL